MLEGTLKRIHSRFQIMNEARTLAKTWMQEALLPQSIQQVMSDEINNVMLILRRLPRRLDRISAAAEHGKLSVQIRMFADPRDNRLLSQLVNRIVLAFLSAVIGLISVFLLEAVDSPKLSGSVTLFDTVGYFGWVVSAALMLGVLAQIACEG
jgi:ubiquinone biosynthesis protein